MAAQANIQINIEDASINELNQEIARLNEELENTSRSTEEGRKKIKSLGQDINKLRGEVQGVEQSFAKVDVGALVGEFGKVAAGLGAAGLALSSFGSENEEVAEVLEKTNAVLALAATAEAIYTVTQEESQIALLAKTASTNLAAAAQAAYTAVVGTSTGALKLFRLALVSTGIGAIVVLIGVLVANWEKLTNAVKESNIGLKEIGNVLLFIAPPIGLLVKGVELLGEKLGGVQNILPAISGAFNAFFTNITDIASSVGDILTGIFTFDLDLIRKGVDDATAIIKQGAADAIKEAEEERRLAQELENRKNNQQLLDYEAERLAIVSDSEEEIFRAKEKALQNNLRAVEIEFGKESEEYKKAYLELLKLQTDFNKKQEEEAQRARDERRKKRKEANDAALNAQAEYEKARLGIFDLSKEEEFKAIDDNLKKELKTIKESAKSKAEIEAASNTATINALFLKTKLIEEEQEQELKAAKETFDFKIALLKEEARLVGDTDRLKELEEETKAATDAYNEQIATIKANAETQLNALTTYGEDQERVVTESLARVAKANEDFTTEVVKAQKDAFDEIIETGIASVLDATADRVEITLQDVTKDYTKAQNIFLGETRKRILEELRLQKAQLEQELEIAEDRLAVLAAIIAARKAAGEDVSGLETEYAGIEKIIAKLKDDLNNLTPEEELLADWIGEDVLEVINSTFGLLNSSLDLIDSRINKITAEYDEQVSKVEADYARQVKLARGNAKEIERIEAEKNAKLSALERKKNQDLKEQQIKAANVQFALAIGQIVVDTAGAIMKALNSPGGPIVRGILVGIATATGVAQLAAANNARNTAIAQANAAAGSGGGSIDPNAGRTAFAEGGFVSGPGGPTSDSIPAMLSDGEFVINAASTRRYLPLLEKINSTPNGYAMGGIVNPPGYSVGGVISALTGITGLRVDEETLEVLKKLDQRLEKPIKSYVVASEIQEGLDSDQYLERRSQIT